MVQTRVCIVTHTFLPHVGGIEKVVYEQSKRLMKRNFKPTVVTSRIDTAKSYTVDNINVECYDSLNTGFRLGIPYSIPTPTSLGTFLTAVKSSDIVHAHGHPYITSLVAAKLAKRYSKPFVLTQHNTFIQYDSMFDNVEHLNDLVIGKETLNEADRIITVSDATKEYVLSLGAKPDKITVLHNGVDLIHFRPLPGKQEEMKKKLGIPRDSIVALTVRRLVYKNGIDTLIESANITVKKNPNVVFLVVGKGPDQNSVQARIRQLGIENNFRLAGFVSDEDLPFYYNAADFFVLPSKSGEGLPLVALEAMACGLPVIATDTGGVNEILIEDYGKLVPPNQPDQMAKAIFEYSRADLSSSTGRLELRATIEEKYNWDKNVETLVEIYEELI
ncbi:MAG TPA: glycosyltransferase family 4 protein [Candidatus Limnocylindrales bacterium]|nr:glycosyltransferase family 4 protein [Candidatus Limnocylindrales bacterium]